jgi:hypothetical protein
MSNSKHASGGRFCIYLNPEDRMRLHELSQSHGGASGSLVIRAALQLAAESGNFSKAFEDTFHRVHLRGV